MAEDILHFGAVRYRVNGIGQLKSTLFSLDDVYSQTLAEITMATATNREPRVLSNFIQQRARLRFGTTDFGEFFKVNRVVIFVKTMWSEYPG